jgi:predicted Zn-dependent protease
VAYYVSVIRNIVSLGLVQKGLYMKLYMKFIQCVTVLLLLAFVFAGCSANPVTGKNELMIFSDSQEINFGSEADPDIVWQFGGAYDDTQLSAYVDNVGQKVAASSERTNIPYHFTIVDSSDINAFALPGGYVYITRGLLVKLENEAQLAAVLGHEIGHINAKHSMKSLQQQLGFSMIMSILDQAASGSEGYQQWRGLIRTGSSVAFSAVSLGYGRDNELQADALGTQFVDKAGYDPQSMTQLLEILKSLSESEPSAVEEFFMSHPRTSIRITEVNTEIAKLPPQQPKGVLNASEYKSKINNLAIIQKAYEHYDKGEDLRQKGQYSQALSEYNQALSIKNMPKPHHGIGLVYYAQNNYAQAINEYKTAIGINSGYIPPLNDLGLAYMKQNQYNDAESAFKKAVSSYENFDDAWSNLGEVFYYKKLYPDAIQALEMAISLNSKHPRAFTTLGLSYEVSGDIQKAIDAYEQAIQIAPNDSYTNTARQHLLSLQKP